MRGEQIKDRKEHDLKQITISTSIPYAIILFLSPSSFFLAFLLAFSLLPSGGLFLQ